MLIKSLNYLTYDQCRYIRNSQANQVIVRSCMHVSVPCYNYTCTNISHYARYENGDINDI